MAVNYGTYGTYKKTDNTGTREYQFCYNSNGGGAGAAISANQPVVRAASAVVTTRSRADGTTEYVRSMDHIYTTTDRNEPNAIGIAIQRIEAGTCGWIQTKGFYPTLNMCADVASTFAAGDTVGTSNKTGYATFGVGLGKLVEAWTMTAAGVCANEIGLDIGIPNISGLGVLVGEVPNHQHGSLSAGFRGGASEVSATHRLEGNTYIIGDHYVDGNLSAMDSIRAQNMIASVVTSSYDTADLHVNDNADIGGRLVLSSTADTTAADPGGLVVSSDIMVLDNVHVTGELSIGEVSRLRGDVGCSADIYVGDDSFLTDDVLIGGRTVMSSTAAGDSLWVSSDAYIGDDLFVTDQASVGGVAIVTGDLSGSDAIFSGNMDVNGTSANFDSYVVVTGDLSGEDAIFSGNMDVNGTSANFDSTVNVTGATTLESTVAITDDLSGSDAIFSGNMDVNGTSANFDSYVVITGDLSGEDAIFSGVLDVEGASAGLPALTVDSITIAGDLSGEDAIFSGNMDVNGTSATFDSYVTVTGDLSGEDAIFSGNMDVNGTSASFNSTVTITADLSGEDAIFSGNMDVNGTSANFDSTVAMTGPVTVTNDLSGSDAIFSGVMDAGTSANVGGITTLTGPVTVTNDLSGSDAIFSGVLDLNGASASFNSTVTITADLSGEDAIFSGNMDVNGTSANFDSTVAMTGPVTVTNDLSGSDAIFSGVMDAGTSANVGGITTLTGPVTVTNDLSGSDAIFSGVMDAGTSANIGGITTLTGPVTVTNDVSGSDAIFSGIIDAGGSARADTLVADGSALGHPGLSSITFTNVQRPDGGAAGCAAYLPNTPDIAKQADWHVCLNTAGSAGWLGVYMGGVRWLVPAWSCSA